MIVYNLCVELHNELKTHVGAHLYYIRKVSNAHAMHTQAMCTADAVAIKCVLKSSAAASAAHTRSWSRQRCAAAQLKLRER